MTNFKNNYKTRRIKKDGHKQTQIIGETKERKQ